MRHILACISSLNTEDSAQKSKGSLYDARIALRDFQRYLIKLGGYDEYHFLRGRRNESKHKVELYARSHSLNPQDIATYHLGHATDRFKQTPYHIIHNFDINMAPSCELRCNLGKMTPVTGMTQSLSYSWLRNIWLQLLLTRVLPCDALVCTSQAALQVVRRSFEYFGEKLHTPSQGKVPKFCGTLDVIPLGVDTDYWHPNDDKQQARKQLGLPGRQCLILCPGRFSVYDKMDLRPLLLAIRSLLDRLGPESFQLLLVGDDKRYGESKLLKKLIKKIGVEQVVRIDTNGDPNVVRQYYGASDVFLSLVDNIQETFGLKVTQAMACGLPTVVSDWNGYKDTVTHGETGFRVPTYWADCDKEISHFASHRHWLYNHLFLAQSVAIDMTKAMDYLYALITNPELRHRQGQAARKRAEQLYSWPTVIGRYRELWDECHRKLDAFDFQQWIHQERRNVLSPVWFRRFSHYPSGIITPETVIVLLAEQDGDSKPQLVDDVFLPPEMENMFQASIFRWLIDRLSKNRTTFRSLREDGSRETGHSHDLVARHIMWLIKYGVIKPMIPDSEPLAVDMNYEAQLNR